MFLVERFIGIGIYTSLLILICLLMVYSNAKCKPMLRVYLMGLCIMAFFYKPYITADLSRIFDTIDFFSNFRFKEFFEDYALPSSVPAARIFYWFIGKTRVYALVSVVSAAVSYSMIFYIIEKTRERYSVSKSNVALTLFFLMTTSIYLSVIGGIRMMMAMSMIVFCFFRENVEKKFNIFHIVLYAIAIFTHNMALFMIVVRVSATIFDSAKKKLTRFLFLALILAGAVFFASNFEAILLDIFENANVYLSGEGYYDIWEYIMGVLILVFVVILLKTYRKYKDQEEYAPFKAFNNSIIYSMIISGVFCFQFSIFYRFAGHFIPLLALPIIMTTLQETTNKPELFRVRSSFKSVLIIFSICIMLISFSRGSMSSLKFFEL